MLAVRGGGASIDPLTLVLQGFCSAASEKLTRLEADAAKAEAKLKELAAWLALQHSDGGLTQKVMPTKSRLNHD